MKHSLTEMAMGIATATPMTDEQKLLAKLNPTASMRCLEHPDVAPRRVMVDPCEPKYHSFGGMVRAYPTVVTWWTGMSNYDHTIDARFAEALKGAPNEAYGFYAGWNFQGRVFWDGTKFRCEVWRYHEVVEIVDAPTLEDIMRELCDRYGDD